MDKSKLLDRVGAVGDDRLLLAKVLDRAEQAQSRNIPAATDFLSPQQQMMTLDLLRLAGVPETGYALFGSSSYMHQREIYGKARSITEIINAQPRSMMNSFLWGLK